MKVAYATAPPSVGNMAVGFDILGHALDAPGDQVRASRSPNPGVQIGQVSGKVAKLPRDPAKNTAGFAVQKLLEAQHAEFGVVLDVYKGIALGSGMGGSAASAVAAVVAVNQLLDEPLPTEALLPFALAGEAVASGAVHGDNVAPCLLGGIVFVPPNDPQHFVRLPVPDDLYCLLVRPEIRLDTSRGRSILASDCRLSDVVAQTTHLATLICACFQNDLGALRRAFQDVLIEPQRSHQIDGFANIKESALQAGALGFSISGSGPSMIAWCDRVDIENVNAAVVSETAKFHVDFEQIRSRVDAPGGQSIIASDWRGKST